MYDYDMTNGGTVYSFHLQNLLNNIALQILQHDLGQRFINELDLYAIVPDEQRFCYIDHVHAGTTDA